MFFSLIRRFQSKFSTKITLNNPRVLIKCVPNNIHVNISNESGRLVSKMTAGSLGFKNTQKVSQKSSATIVDELKRRLDEFSVSSIKLELNGFNSMRPFLIYQLRRSGISITEIYDTTGIPFNGCRPKKTRRL
jgi:small subunit ribosomal protein S11